MFSTSNVSYILEEYFLGKDYKTSHLIVLLI